MRFRPILSSFALMFLLAPGTHCLLAQTITGSLRGTVHDSTGALIPGASVSATNTETGAVRKAQTNGSGAYEISGVPAGVYNVEATNRGFRTELRKGVTLTVGATVNVDFSLSPGEVQETVVVTGEAPQIETSSPAVSGVVGETLIRELPLNGRDWLQLATLQAGVVGGLGQQSGAVLTNSRAARGNGENLYISGNRPTENVYLVNGLVVNDYANGSPGSGLNVNLGVDAVREFVVLTSEYSAQYGMTGGGVVSAIFKSGTNDFHGSSFVFVRNSAMDARNFFDGASVPPFHRYQYGGSIGGPIRKTRTFFFASFEGLQQDLSLSESSNTLSPNARNGILTCINPPLCTQSGTVTIDPRIKPYLALFPDSNGPITGDSAKFNFAGAERGHEYYLVGKIDHNFSTFTTLSGSYQWDTGALTQPDPYNQKLVGSPSRHNNFILSLQHSFSSNLVNTARLGFSRSYAADAQDVSALIPAATDPSLGFLPGLPVGVLTVPGLTGTAGGLGASGSDIFNFTSYQESDDLVWVRQRHTLLFGAAAIRFDDNFNSANIPLGEWDYGSISNFLTNQPDDFTSDFPGTNGGRGLRTTYFGTYAQDNFRIRPDLTLNLGLRYEITTPVTEVNGKVATLVNLTDAAPRTGGNFFNNPTLKNFAPRAGIAWDPFGKGKTAIRAGFGIYDILPLPYLLVNRTHSTPFFLQGTANSPPPNAFPSSGLSLLTPNTARVAFVQANPSRAYNQQWNFTIQQQVTPNLAVMVGYVGSHAVHVPMGIEDMDQVPPSLVTVSPDGHLLFPTSGKIQRINPNFGRIVGTMWIDYAKYNALLVNVSKRFSGGFSLQGAYTWSKSMDDGSATFSDNEYLNTAGPSYAYDIALQSGPSDFDITHTGVVNGTWEIPVPSSFRGTSRVFLGGWQVGGIFQAHTGMPFTVKLSSDQARTGNSRASSSAGAQRPNFNPIPGCSPNAVNPGQPLNYINTQCFSFPALGQLGNLGRNTLRGPGLEETDFSLFKNFAFAGERCKLQVRAEVFNLLNHTNFGVGTTAVFNKQGAVIPTAGQLLPPTLTTSRQMQLGAKFSW
jgi:hypothetical protein